MRPSRTLDSEKIGDVAGVAQEITSAWAAASSASSTCSPPTISASNLALTGFAGPDHHPFDRPHRPHRLYLIEGHRPGPEHGQRASTIGRQQRRRQSTTAPVRIAVSVGPWTRPRGLPSGANHDQACGITGDRRHHLHRDDVLEPPRHDQRTADDGPHRGSRPRRRRRLHRPDRIGHRKSLAGLRRVEVPHQARTFFTATSIGSRSTARKLMGTSVSNSMEAPV